MYEKVEYTVKDQFGNQIWNLEAAIGFVHIYQRCQNNLQLNLWAAQLFGRNLAWPGLTKQFLLVKL